jgi:hypothetical protein
MNPVEEFLQIKHAAGPPGAIMSAIKRVKGAVRGGVEQVAGLPLTQAAGWGLGIAGGGAAGYAAFGVGAEKLYDAATKKRDFNRMMEANPHLKPYQSEDPEGFNRMFSALRSMNPDFSSEPLVAGSYMHEAMETPPEERGMVAVKALQAAKMLPTRPIREVAGMGAAQFARAAGSAPRAPSPMQLGSREDVFERGEGGLEPSRRVLKTVQYGQPPTE